MAHRILSALFVLAPFLSFGGNKPETAELPKPFRDRFASIPAGVLTMKDGEVKVPAFMISNTEVSNADYMAFVAQVRSSGDAQRLSAVAPDTMQWRKDHTYNEPYVVHYHAHPAYANYPAVNISYEGAVAYCQWLQEQLNAEAPKGKHYTVRLPSRIEWWYAANGGNQSMRYAWGGPALRNAKGCTLANYRYVGDENVRRDPATGKVQVVDQPEVYMGVAGALADNVDITAPVDSYSPNAYGLYNMNGNVAELLADGSQAAGGSWRSPGFDVRNESVMAFNGPSPEVGFRVVVEVR